MFFYKLYGLVIESDIEFPEMYQLEDSPKSVDASLLLSEPPEWVKKEYLEERKYSSLSPSVMWFRLNEELLIYVENGSKALIWILNENIPPARLRTYVLSGAMTFLLFQNNYILLHGSAIYDTHTSSAFVISGPSGSGKSTTALKILDDKRYLFASDDICAVKLNNNEAILYPGPPWQRVCEDVAQRIGIDKFCYIPEETDKYGRRLTDGYICNPCLLSAQYIIEKDDVTDVEFVKFQGEACFQAITHNLFRGELHNLLGITPTKMLSFIQLSNLITVYHINRPTHKNTLSEICEIIQKSRL